MINSKDISVVVQGAIDKKNTPKCLRSIRHFLPEAEIILSTWEGSDVSSLDYDKVILNEDPGSFDMSTREKNNVKRQIVSTLNGIRASDRKYIFKLRSDIELTSCGFLKYFDKFDSYDNSWHFLEKRIIICNMFTRNPETWGSPMCPSDWVSFGLAEDMLKLWDIPFPSAQEEVWFLNHKKSLNVKTHDPNLIARYNPEQHIWISFVRKFTDNIECEDMFDKNEASVQATNLSFSNNLIILSCNQFGIRQLKKLNPGYCTWDVLTHNDFLRMYNKYSNGDRFIFPIDFERTALFLEEACKRLNKTMRLICLMPAMR